MVVSPSMAFLNKALMNLYLDTKRALKPVLTLEQEGVSAKPKRAKRTRGRETASRRETFIRFSRIRGVALREGATSRVIHERVGMKNASRPSSTTLACFKHTSDDTKMLFTCLRFSVFHSHISPRDRNPLSGVWPTRRLSP